MKNTIRYASGTRTQHETYQSATAEIRGAYPDAYLHEDSDRVLVWATEEDSEGDNGSNAVAEIIEDDDDE